jgi:Fe-S cluster assembly iron-binding protein IscA
MERERRSEGTRIGLITITEAATSCFLKIKPSGHSNDEVMRLDEVMDSTDGAETRVAVYLGEPEEGDEPVTYRGESLLYVSRMVSAAFDGCVVDLIEVPEGVGFTIGPPEA